MGCNCVLPAVDSKIEPTAWHPQIDFNVTGDAEESYFPAVDMTDGKLLCCIFYMLNSTSMY